MIPHERLLATLAAAGVVGSACDAPRCPEDWCGTVVVGASGEAGSLLPPSADSQIEIQLVDLIFSKLAEIGPGLNTIGDSGFVPQLATAWSFDNPQTLRFTLDAAARWHDGTPVTATDVVFSFDVYRDTLVNALARPRLSDLRRVTAVDDHTVVLEFGAPYAELFFDAVYHVRIMPRHVLDTIPRNQLTAHPIGRSPVGSGPYRFVRWRASEFVELEADSTYFGGRPGLRRIIWRFHPDFGALVPQLLAGEIDVVEFLGSPTNAERVEQAPDLELVKYPSLGYVYVAFNLRDPQQLSQPHPLFGDRALRRALAMAVDRQTAVQAVYGPLGLPAYGPIARSYSVWSDTLPRISFDSAAARRSLDELGWRDGDGDGVRERRGRRLAFDLSVPSSSGARMRLAQVIQEQLKPLGVEITITPFDFETTFQRARDGTFDAVFGGYSGDPSPVSIAEVWSSAGTAGFNYGHYVRADVEQLITRARQASTPEAARPLWQAAVTEIVQDAPAIFLVEPVMFAGVHARFENVRFRPDQAMAYLWRWRVPDDRIIERDRYGVQVR